MMLKGIGKIKLNSKKTINFAKTIVLLSLGFIAGKFFNIYYFSIDEKVNLVDILSILATIFAAYVVSKVIDKEKEDHRTEKDLILKRIEDIYQLISSSQSKLTEPQVPYQVAGSTVKQIFTSVNTACKVLSHTSIKLEDDYKAKIVSNLRAIKNLLTKGPEVVDGIIKLNGNVRTEIEAEFSKLKDNVLLFQIALNKG